MIFYHMLSNILNHACSLCSLHESDNLLVSFILYIHDPVCTNLKKHVSRVFEVLN